MHGIEKSFAIFLEMPSTRYRMFCYNFQSNEHRPCILTKGYSIKCQTDGFSNGTKRQSWKVCKWCVQENCSKHKQQQPEFI